MSATYCWPDDDGNHDDRLRAQRPRSSDRHRTNTSGDGVGSTTTVSSKPSSSSTAAAASTNQKTTPLLESVMRAAASMLAGFALGGADVRTCISSGYDDGRFFNNIFINLPVVKFRVGGNTDQ